VGLTLHSISMEVLLCIEATMGQLQVVRQWASVVDGVLCQRMLLPL
jgi:hypothetical protein